MQVELLNETVRLKLAEIYKAGRIASPRSTSQPGHVYTFSSQVQTTLAPFAGNYVMWLELEFFDASGHSLTVERSPELAGAQPAQLLAVTARAPERAAFLRTGIAAQNRFGILMPGSVVASTPVLTDGGSMMSGDVTPEQLYSFSQTPGPRTARVKFVAPWPDGTSLSLTSDRGHIAPSVILRNGSAEAEVHYTATEAGAARITATVLDRKAGIDLRDPLTGTLRLSEFRRDGQPTDALVQLIRAGDMLPGRYKQAGGMYVQAPASIELLPGRWKLRVLQGPQFLPFEQDIEIATGSAVDAGPIELRRGVDLRSAGWYAGDPDGDVYHGESIFTDVGANTAAMAAKAVGLDWVTPANWRKPKPATWSDARLTMASLSTPNLLFRWADEKKWISGHFCFVGLNRPDSEPFDQFWKSIRSLQQYQGLVALRKSGAVSFLNHPVRYWVTDGKFTTNMYSGIAFDVVAAKLVDGLHLTEGGGRVLQLWSLLLDHGYRIAATGGTDFAFDHARAGQPGTARLYVHCADGLTEQCLTDSIRKGTTVASTGPMLTAVTASGLLPGSILELDKTHRLHARAWARYDSDDRILRIELWSHGKAIASRQPSDPAARKMETDFDWTPSGSWDWCAIRVLTKEGWAMSNAFFAASKDWKEPQPVLSRVTLVAPPGHNELAGASVQIWDNVPEAPGSVLIRELTMEQALARVFEAPVTATIRVRTQDGTVHDNTIWDASGARNLSESIARGDRLDAPLLEWSTYEEVLRMCRNVTMRVGAL